MLLKKLDENQAIDNWIIPPYVTGTLKNLMHMMHMHLYSKHTMLTQKIESHLQQR